MKLEDHVCALSQAKRLKELGVNGKSYFHWVFRNKPREFWQVEELGVFEGLQSPQDEYSAFTVAELGIMLPDAYISWFDGEFWHCDIDEDSSFYLLGKTEAEARCEQLITLLISGEITIEEINKRLFE